MIEVDACVQLGVDRMSLVQFALLLPKPSMGKAKSSIRICTFPACILLGKTLTADIGDRFCLVLVRGDFCSIAAKWYPPATNQIKISNLRTKTARNSKPDTTFKQWVWSGIKSWFSSSQLLFFLSLDVGLSSVRCGLVIPEHKAGEGVSHGCIAVAAVRSFLNNVPENLQYHMEQFPRRFCHQCQGKESGSVPSAVHCLFTLLSWNYADTGLKGTTFCLEELIDLNCIHTGVVRFDNTRPRKEDLASAICAGHRHVL